jgi:AcrR family transcriptional regulator
MKFGQRDLNKAKTKLACLDSMYRLSKEIGFKQLKAKDIATDAGITEMTFFNYFKTKEDLLQYFMKIWTLDQMAEQLEKPLKGKAAIERIFQNTAEESLKHTTILTSLIGYIAALTQAPTPIVIQPAEIYLRYPDLPELWPQEVNSLAELFLNHLNELDDSNPQQTLALLNSAFYGNALHAHTSGVALWPLYQLNLNTIFGQKT